MEGLAAFFSKSTKRTNLLDEIVRCRIPRASGVRWNSNSRLVQTILHHVPDLIQVFRTIREGDSDDWDNDTMMKASGFESWLNKSSTYFLLMVYGAVFEVTDSLFSFVQVKVMDITQCSVRVTDTMRTLNAQRQNFDSVYSRFEEKCRDLQLVNDTPRNGSSEIDLRRRLFYSILDNITVSMKTRFDNMGELSFLGLVDCTKFAEMKHNFAEAKLENLSTTYAKFFDLVRLRTDLIGLYSATMVQGMSPAQLLKFLSVHGLEGTVPEATKLLKLVLTIPATTASVERSFSALKRIKTYSRNRMGGERLSSLAIISIEKERLVKLRRKDREGFYNEVINNFVRKERRMDFIYK